MTRKEQIKTIVEHHYFTNGNCLDKTFKHVQEKHAVAYFNWDEFITAITTLKELNEKFKHNFYCSHCANPLDFEDFDNGDCDLCDEMEENEE